MKTWPGGTQQHPNALKLSDCAGRSAMFVATTAAKRTPEPDPEDT
jgi:hypothetical protein